MNVLSFLRYTALMHSAKEGHMRCVRILLKHGARVFAHVKGSTSKQLALNNGNGRIAELLAGSEESEIRNGAVPAYSRVYDPRSGSYYYYHNFTGITVRKNAGEYYGTNWYIKTINTPYKPINTCLIPSSHR